MLLPLCHQLSRRPFISPSRRSLPCYPYSSDLRPQPMASATPTLRVTPSNQPRISTKDDLPYTLPEEDPFNITPLFRQPRRRRSSLFNKWIVDQQTYASTLEGIPDDIHDAPDSGSTIGSTAHDFLAVPGESRSLNPSANASAVTLKSYDFVEDTDIPDDPNFAPSTPTHSNRTSRFFSTPPSIKSLHLSFRSSSPRPQTPTPASSTPAHTPTRPSFFPLMPRPGSNKGTHRPHNRSSSLGTLSISSSAPRTPPTSPRWRPSVLGHFSSPTGSQVSVQPSDTAYTPSRPSLSSTNTHTSTTITDITTPLSKLSFGDSVRSRSISHGGAFYDLNADELSIASNVALERLPNKKLKKARSSRVPLSTTDSNTPSETKPAGPQVAFTSTTKGGSVPRVSFSSLSSRNQKKKKLIVSGIGPNDTRRFEGVKQWCESFGEVSQIMRMPNGDLHVHFRSAEVADTVCRLRAKVFISGVGSVDLSWYAGNKR
ncbi:hypothetical protein CPB85DRAFT_19005 [Mucidula mucida]|nr:hypothetical protein CPB85DRAFT_19005 [Mucidula mucida]